MACSRIMNGIHAQHALHCVACTLESPSRVCLPKIHTCIVKAVLWDKTTPLHVGIILSTKFSAPCGDEASVKSQSQKRQNRKPTAPGSHKSQTPGQRTLWTTLWPLPPLSCDQCERKHACHHSPSALHACREHAGGCFAHLSLHNSAY
jgi:hypothetical protein